MDKNLIFWHVLNILRPEIRKSPKQTSYLKASFLTITDLYHTFKKSFFKPLFLQTVFLRLIVIPWNLFQMLAKCAIQLNLLAIVNTRYVILSLHVIKFPKNLNIGRLLSTVYRSKIIAIDLHGQILSHTLSQISLKLSTQPLIQCSSMFMVSAHVRIAESLLNRL